MDRRPNPLAFFRWNQTHRPANADEHELEQLHPAVDADARAGLFPHTGLPRSVRSDQRSPSYGGPQQASSDTSSEFHYTQETFDEEYPDHLRFYEDVADGVPYNWDPPISGDIYERLRVYTGTTSTRLARVRETGADPNVMNPGIAESMRQRFAEDPLGNFHSLEELANLGKHNYGSRKNQLGTGSSADPKWYASMATSNDRDAGEASAERALMRSFWPPDILRVERDPDVKSAEAWRTPDFVPPGLILASGGQAPRVTEASEIYRDWLNSYAMTFGAHHGIWIRPLTADDAAKVLHRRQTPSEWDFNIPRRKIPIEP